MTTGISLVRENTESMQPPRALWVSFPLGRPLGIPNNADFQHRVIGAALNLLTHTRGPVLADYAEDAPAVNVEATPICPVSFATTRSDDTWLGRLTAELATLKPWYELGRRRRDGRTLVGVADSSIEEIFARLADYLDAGQLPTGELRWFKQSIEDAKAYYVEALTAQPGDYDPSRVYQTLWSDTQLGIGLRIFHDGFYAHPKLQSFARIILPREAVGNAPGTPGGANDDS